MNKNELKLVLDKERFDPRACSLDGGLHNDTLCLAAEGERWCVYYTERGIRFDEEWFNTEDEACRRLLSRLRFLPESQTRLPDPDLRDDPGRYGPSDRDRDRRWPGAGDALDDVSGHRRDGGGEHPVR